MADVLRGSLQHRYHQNGTENGALLAPPAVATKQQPQQQRPVTSPKQNNRWGKARLVCLLHVFFQGATLTPPPSEPFLARHSSLPPPGSSCRPLSLRTISAGAAGSSRGCVPSSRAHPHLPTRELLTSEISSPACSSPRLTALASPPPSSNVRRRLTGSTFPISRCRGTLRLPRSAPRKSRPSSAPRRPPSRPPSPPRGRRPPPRRSRPGRLPSRRRCSRSLPSCSRGLRRPRLSPLPRRLLPLLLLQPQLRPQCSGRHLRPNRCATQGRDRQEGR